MNFLILPRHWSNNSTLYGNPEAKYVSPLGTVSESDADYIVSRNGSYLLG